MSLDFKEVVWLRYLVISTRALFLLGVCLLVAGGSLEGQYKKRAMATAGLKLVKAGYVVIAIIFAILLGFQAYFWLMKRALSSSSLTVSGYDSRTSHEDPEMLIPPTDT